MSLELNKRFEVIITGTQSGAIDKWKKIPLIIDSKWDAGSDGEKFEVLTAIRKTYNPEIKSDIRGNERQTPTQIGRCEGFRELKYQRPTPSSPQVIIVPAVMQYRSLVPHSRIENNQALIAKCGFAVSN